MCLCNTFTVQYKLAISHQITRKTQGSFELRRNQKRASWRKGKQSGDVSLVIGPCGIVLFLPDPILHLQCLVLHIVPF